MPGMCTNPCSRPLCRIVVSGTTLSGYSCSCVDTAGQPGTAPRNAACLAPGLGGGGLQNPHDQRVVSWSVVMRLGWPCLHLYSLRVRAGRVIKIAPRSLVPTPWAVYDAWRVPAKTSGYLQFAS